MIEKFDCLYELFFTNLFSDYFMPMCHEELCADGMYHYICTDTTGRTSFEHLNIHPCS